MARMPLWLQRFLAGCLLLAVGVTLFNGQVVGYRCDCNKVAVVVPVPDCHELECHPGHAHADGCESDTDHPSGKADHSHHHPPVVSQLEWTKLEADWSGLPFVGPIPPVMTSPADRGLATSQAPALLPVVNHSPPPPRRSYLTSLLLI